MQIRLFNKNQIESLYVKIKLLPKLKKYSSTNNEKPKLKNQSSLTLQKCSLFIPLVPIHVLLKKTKLNENIY